MSGTSITTRCSGSERTLPTAATRTSETLDQDNFIIDGDVLPKLKFTYRVSAHLDDPAATVRGPICP